MKNIWKFAPEKGKERNLLTVFILHILEKEPRSGYGLLKDFGEITNGTWIPNKGTLYPILRSLEEEGQIQVKELGKRSKRVYELTDAGKQTLSILKYKREESQDKINFFKQLHLEIFGEENITLLNLLTDIRFYVEDLPEDKKEIAIKLLTRSFDSIREL